MRITAPRLLIRFETHPRWPPVTKGLHLDHFTEKMRDCEHSNYSLYHPDCPLILCVINYAQNDGFLLGYPIENSTALESLWHNFWFAIFFEFFDEIPVGILLNVLFRVFEFSKASFNALSSPFT